MHLEQLNLSYLISEDRIVLKIGFSLAEHEEIKKEIQVFLTRRMLKKMWPTLMEAISAHMRINRPEAAFASDELVEMERENALNAMRDGGNFDQAYDDVQRESVHGTKPLLLDRIQFHLKLNEAFWIQFFPQEGGTIDLKLETPLLHGFCKLLIDAEKSSDWDLQLTLPSSEQLHIPAHRLN